MNPIPLIKCNDYDTGNFIPESFDPVLKWKITYSEFDDPEYNLPKQIVLKAIVLRHVLKVRSKPFSFGKFAAEFRKLHLFIDLNTNDPEEALYLTERFFKAWIEDHIKYYTAFKNVLNRNEEK